MSYDIHSIQERNRWAIGFMMTLVGSQLAFSSWHRHIAKNNIFNLHARGKCPHIHHNMNDRNIISRSTLTIFRSCIDIFNTIYNPDANCMGVIKLLCNLRTPLMTQDIYYADMYMWTQRQPIFHTIDVAHQCHHEINILCHQLPP